MEGWASSTGLQPRISRLAHGAPLFHIQDVGAFARFGFGFRFNVLPALPAELSKLLLAHFKRPTGFV